MGNSSENVGKFARRCVMDRMTYEQFFLHPTDPWHRRYEVLRAVFVEQQPIQEVAHQFDVSNATIWNWASEFRCQPLSAAARQSRTEHTDFLRRGIPQPCPVLCQRQPDAEAAIIRDSTVH